MADPFANARWERMHDIERPNSSEKTEFTRIRVPGGWLYRTVAFYGYMGSGAGTAVAQTFIPDPTHGD